MDTGLSPFRMELVLTEFYVARGGPVLRPSMKCTVHESRAHLNGEEGRCWWCCCCCCCTQRTLPSTERTSHWPIGQSRHGPKEDDRRSLVSNGSPWVDSCDDLSSLLSHSRHSSSSFLIVYELHTHTHTHISHIRVRFSALCLHYSLSPSIISLFLSLLFLRSYVSVSFSLSLLFLLAELTCFFVFLNRTLHDRSSLSIGLSSLQSAVIFSCRSYFRRAHPTSSPEAALHGLFSAHCLEAPAGVTGFPG